MLMQMTSLVCVKTLEQQKKYSNVLKNGQSAIKWNLIIVNVVFSFLIKKKNKQTIGN